MPKVNPEILVWARETADLSLDKAAKAIGISDGRKKSGQEKLADLEAGNTEPSRSQLRKMSQKYRRPLLAFYLQRPPPRGDRGSDFRTVPGAEPPEYDPNLDALIRDIRSRQSLAKSVLEDEQAPPLAFVGSAQIADGADSLAVTIQQTIGFEIEKFRSQDSVSKAFDYLRSRIEAVRIFVLLIGNLGSHHTNISPEIFRGFAISDDVAPFVVVNDQDARAAWSFTTLHEVAHLWLGTTGISGTSFEAQIERFCNDVAAKILLPHRDILELHGIDSLTPEEAIERISVFANTRKISRAMVAYALLRANFVSHGVWQSLKDHYYQEWLATKARKQEEQQGAKGAPSYYVVRRHRLGPALLHLATRSLSEGMLTYTKAGQLLGVKPRNVEPLLHSTSPPGG